MELTLPNGDPCIYDKNKNFETIFEIVCNPKATFPTFDTSNELAFNSTSCKNKIKLYSKDACPNFSFYGFFNEIISNKFIFGPILIIFGIFLCFFGYKFYNVLCIISGILFVSFVVLFLVLSNINIEFSTLGFWLLIAGVVLTGILVGYLFIKYELNFLIDIVIAGFAGFLLGTFLYNFALNQISTNTKIVYYCTIVFSIILLEFLILMFRKFMIIFCTSFMGAYGIIRGLSFMIGGFPSEKEVMDLIENQEWEQLKEVN